jgi:hypothetical protein
MTTDIRTMLVERLAALESDAEAIRNAIKTIIDSADAPGHAPATRRLRRSSLNATARRRRQEFWVEKFKANHKCWAA